MGSLPVNRLEATFVALKLRGELLCSLTVAFSRSSSSRQRVSSSPSGLGLWYPSANSNLSKDRSLCSERCRAGAKWVGLASTSGSRPVKYTIGRHLASMLPTRHRVDTPTWLRGIRCMDCPSGPNQVLQLAPRVLESVVLHGPHKQQHSYLVFGAVTDLFQPGNPTNSSKTSPSSQNIQT
jgi:hypothetical protein